MNRKITRLARGVKCGAGGPAVSAARPSDANSCASPSTPKPLAKVRSIRRRDGAGAVIPRPPGPDDGTWVGIRLVNVVSHAHVVNRGSIAPSFAGVMTTFYGMGLRIVAARGSNRGHDCPKFA